MLEVLNLSLTPREQLDAQAGCDAAQLRGGVPLFELLFLASWPLPFENRLWEDLRADPCLA